MSDKKNIPRSFRFDIRHLISVLCFLISGCGFHSIYGARDDHAPVATELNEVAIEGIPDRDGQMLRNNLIDRMYRRGRPQSPKYHLEVRLRTSQEGIGLLPNATTSLTELNLYADYVLRGEGGKELVSATARATANFNQLQAEYGTLAAEQNANQRCIEEVSEQIVNRLSLFFSEGTTIAPGPKVNRVPIPGLVPRPPS